MHLIKYGIPLDGNTGNISEFIYKKEYVIEKIEGIHRLKISPENKHVKLMLDLFLKNKNSDFNYSILYILLVSRCGNQLGRYEKEETMNWIELEQFCKKYSSYLESDGRHNFWIINHETNDLAIYDRHNILYAYENLEPKIKLLEKFGYKKTDEINIICPHAHHYNQENDHFENDLIKNNNWIITPLTEMD